MRVGVCLTDLTPELGGGYTIQRDIFLSLSELANESRHTFVAFAPRDFVKQSTSQGKDRLQIAPYPPPNLIERGVAKATRELQAFRILWNHPSQLDHIAHKWDIDFMWLASALPVQTDVPYLTMVWDLQHLVQPWFPEVSANGIWDKRQAYHSWFLGKASVILAGTNAGRKEIEQFFRIPSERIKIIPHPTPQFALNARPDISRDTLEKYRVPDNYLFYPAQFWAHKNHANLLWALYRLREMHKLVVPAVFVGSDKGNQSYIRRLAEELGISEQVYFLGFVSQDDLIALYRNALALVYLTFFGPENLPPLEAFALGCPVIASNVAGAEEQLGEAALLVDPKSPEQIAQAIKSLFDTPSLRNTLVQRGLTRASKWTGRDFVRGVFSILDEFESIRRCWD